MICEPRPTGVSVEGAQGPCCWLRYSMTTQAGGVETRRRASRGVQTCDDTWRG